LLGFDVVQSSVAKYMIRRRGPSGQGWRTFLCNHTPGIAAMDLFVVPTIGFRMLYAFVIVRLDRRHLVWINATTNPTAERVAQQIGEAHLRRLLRDYSHYYSTIKTHRSWSTTRRYRGLFSATEVSLRAEFWADFITPTSGLELSDSRTYREPYPPSAGAFAPHLISA
jgi:hypothetical protein